MNSTQDVDIAKIDTSIRMIKEYIKESGINPLIVVVEALKKDPNNVSFVTQLSDALRDIGPMQGAVFTYAPYLTNFLSDDPFENI